MFGVVVGTYSSIFVVAPLLLRLGVKRDWSGINQGQGASAASEPATATPKS